MTVIGLHRTAQNESRELSDEILIRMAAEGKREGMEELVRRYQTPLYRFLTRFLGSAEDAEQATLNVFVRVWQHAPRFQYRSQVSTWLYRIATNMARDMHTARSSRPKTEALPEEWRLKDGLVGDAEQEAMRRMERQDQFRQMQEALQKLNETDRMLLILYYLEDRSYEEIQEVSGYSYKVLKTRLARARARLRNLLGDDI